MSSPYSEPKKKDETHYSQYLPEGQILPPCSEGGRKTFGSRRRYCPADILIEMGNVSKTNYEAWRKGQVPYLERVFEGSLSKANRILRIIGFHVHDLNMVSRQTVYHQWGKGRNRILRFSKSADPNIEKAYSRHYSWNQSPQKKQIAINNALPKQGGAVDQGYSGPIENR